MKIKPVHPFAARMAPEIAFEVLDGLRPKSLVLDPMSGSGTVLRTISELGFKGLGFDVDPLAVLMAKAWTSKIAPKSFLAQAKNLTDTALQLNSDHIFLPWIDDDQETQDFIAFWFGAEQIADLRRLTFIIHQNLNEFTDLFKIALSRLIITKTSGASLAADVSHSRPHKVREVNDFDVFDGFKLSCNKLARSITPEKLHGSVQVNRGDARQLSQVKSNSIDSIITSPPYLNALDYMRGHKLSLVWLGYKIGELKSIRGNSVGAEKAPDNFDNILQAKQITRNMNGLYTLPQRKINMIYRYALDMENILRESARVLKKNRNATFVVGNSSLQGVYIENTLITEQAAELCGLKLIHSREREIPPNKRYLPPPKDTTTSSFNARMRTEAVMTFKKIM
ncbi:hypothetical protein [Mucilaginibacter sp. KACC 22063]|uniref:hypothetical protein n=1 Tax=Mucilaginibacter sp. KACC 22063 TaxID=3025666 RepID=UPI002365C0FB|nr:hypothetical protein [Mucilaginibacter sp. KACC 22063]WDF54335.1 hypothetical protein PQ461_15430 [Mucilaginibacter sp. KACC 22063]